MSLPARRGAAAAARPGGATERGAAGGGCFHPRLPNGPACPGIHTPSVPPTPRRSFDEFVCMAQDRIFLSGKVCAESDAADGDATDELSAAVAAAILVPLLARW